MSKSDFKFRRAMYLFLLNTLRVPRGIATNVIKAIARTVHPGAARRRKELANIPDTAPLLIVSDELGMRFVKPNELPGTQELLNRCRKIFEEYRVSGRLEQRMGTGAKPFLMQVTDLSDEVMRHKEVQDFVLSETLINTAIRYMGQVPLLTGARLLWSPVNDSNIKSQQYHFDAEDFRQLKIFINIEEVTAECGPLHVISSRVSSKIKDLTGYKGGRRTRLSDELVRANSKAEDEIVVIGSAGTGIICDTSRCLHFGSRGNRSERLILLIQFMDYFAPKIEPTNWEAAFARSTPDNELKKLVLNLA